MCVFIYGVRSTHPSILMQLNEYIVSIGGGLESVTCINPIISKCIHTACMC